MILRKKFRIIVKNGIVISYGEYNIESETNIAFDCDGFDFNTEQEMLDFININKFKIVENEEIPYQ
jgi:hypothetical protein